MGGKFSKNDDSEKRSLKELAKETKLNKIEINELYRVFKEIAPEGWVDREKFDEALKVLEKHGVNSSLHELTNQKLFDILDVNKDNKVDFKEFVSGFALLCKGNTEDKIRISFEVFDRDGSNSISKDEFYEVVYFAWNAAFRTLFVHHNEIRVPDDQVHQFCKESAQGFVDSVFEEIDINNDGVLSYEEFKLFAIQNPKITAGLLHFEEEIQLLL